MHDELIDGVSVKSFNRVGPFYETYFTIRKRKAGSQLKPDFNMQTREALNLFSMHRPPKLRDEDFAATGATERVFDRKC